AARQLISTRLTARLCVDIAPVSVQLRTDGSRRLFSSLFAKKDRYPASDDPDGIVLTQAAAEVLSGSSLIAVSGREARFLLQPGAVSPQESRLAVQFTPLVGRDEVLHTLAATARRCFDDGEPTLVSVVGDAGYGRTALASALALRLSDPLRVELV